MNILITGAKGQLGSQIMNIIKDGKSELGAIPTQVAEAKVIGIDIKDLDLTDLKAVRLYLKELKPDVVINPAAFTNVDACETSIDTAFKVNALAARNMAMVCEEIGAKLIHISTDYVFSGVGTVPLKEHDMTAPVSIYGKTKLAGENFVREFCSKYFIVRTAWLYGYNGKNFVYTIMNAAKEKGHLTVVDDQRGNPTNAEDLAHHIVKLAVTEDYGVYHCTGEGECSWYDFAKAIVEYSGINCTVDPITSEQLVNRAAKRPAYSSLDNMMLRCTVGNEMRDWKEALKEFINKINV
ncbi:dTDP-4-dehydrorhamnose reductase [Clostridium amylolyticum]|uniref:dTDP-4-dehydrorhamnose reductase n=1 Tax=Clostridium amylolyticum TaxID=1121298 RepID=A0A1M6M8U2_9CLOT|nr:dTDP-4-dehydrorhamnose reductase [Clostridium amylolyticum]SHJ79703.1 dTDP-4-dehydrorhamnose reductase [Clostridium amylolyticum]